MKTKPIIKDRLAYVLETRRKETGNKRRPNFTTVSNELGYSEVKNFQRQLALGEILTDHLEKISVFLDVSPDYLSGKIDLLKNGEIPTYTHYLFWNRFDKWSQKHTLFDLTIALLKLQGASPENYTRYQIISLSLRLVGLVNDFVAAGNMFLQDDIEKEGKENG